jgi:hypothetical protein
MTLTPPIYDLTDKNALFPISYGLQPVRGWPARHRDDIVGQLTRRSKLQGLAEGPWDGIDNGRLWVHQFRIPETDYVFHPGDAADLMADGIFPDEPPHPLTARLSVKAPAGLPEGDVEDVFGIYRCLRTANFNDVGKQLDVNGNIVGDIGPGMDPDKFFYYPNFANVALDQIVRWARRRPVIVNYKALVDWRDWNDELIAWDDNKYTPRSVSLTPTMGGGLVPGSVIAVRVSAVKAGNESSASQRSASILNTTVTLPAGYTALVIDWLIKGDELEPTENPTDHDGYNVYFKINAGPWRKVYVAGEGNRNYYLDTPTVGALQDPPVTTHASFLRNIKRFECMIYLIPPYDLSSALDRICQLSCADWQWSGWGTNTYRNDKLRFLSPVGREPVFTIDLKEIGRDTFRTWEIDSRTYPNQIVVAFRDRDDEFLGPADPVVLTRDDLVLADGQTKTLNIDAGTCYRSMAQRIASFWARALCDYRQMAQSLTSGIKTYHLLPADVVEIKPTNILPDWNPLQFMVVTKKEMNKGKLGDDLLMRLYSPSFYSDNDHEPLPSGLPPRRVNPFAAPPQVVSLTTSEVGGFTSDGGWAARIRVEFNFVSFVIQQRARVEYKLVDDVNWIVSGTVTIASADNHAYYEIPALEKGNYDVRVISETAFNKADAGEALTTAQYVQDIPPAPPVLDELSIALSNEVTHEGLPYIIGIAVFAPYAGHQIAKIMYKLTSDSVWTLYPGPLLIPTRDTLEVSFEMRGLPVGDYNVRIVTYSDPEGSTLAFSAQSTQNISVIIPPELQPINFSGLFGVDGTLAIEWDGTSFLDNPSIERYRLIVFNVPGGTPAQVREVELGPAAALSEYGLFDITTDAGSRVTLLSDGGVDIAPAFWVVELNSINSSSPRGGLYFEYTIVDAAPTFVTLYPLNTYGYDFGLDGAFIWARATDTFGKYFYHPDTGDTIDTHRIKADTGTRFGILLRPDGVIEYHVNRRDALSVPIYTSRKRVQWDQQYRVYIRDNGEALTPALGIRNMRWIRYGNEFRYTPQMQRADFGLTDLDPLPDSFDVNVYQYSRFPNGPLSNPTTGTFVRP